jgi:GTP cyclohydrolase II
LEYQLKNKHYDAKNMIIRIYKSADCEEITKLFYDTIHNVNSADYSKEQRDYGIGAQILHDLGISKIKLITSQPRRRVGIKAFGLDIIEHIDPATI